MYKKSVFINAAAIAIAGLVSQGAMAADGNINFTGQIVDTPCSVSPASASLTVPLGSVSNASLAGAAGKKSTPAKFTLNLVSCGASAKTATVTFSGTADATVTDALKLSNSGTTTASATGVAVEIDDSTGTKIALNKASSAYVLGAGDNALQFQAVYVSTGTAVTSGPANATAQFTVAYQ